MADTKLSALTALGAAPATNDLLYLDDVSASASKSMTVANLFTSPTLTTPDIGVATATSVNKVAITAPAASATLTISNGKTLAATASITLAGTDGKTLTISNNLTLAGTDATVMTFPSTSATIARTDAANTFTGVQTFTNITLVTNGQILMTLPSTDTHATGPTTSSFVSGYSSTAIGDLMYLDTNAKWQKTDADALATTTGMLGIALSVAAADAAVLVALPGSFVYATAFITFTVGAPVYVGETAGAMQTAIPTGADSAVRVIGYGVHADKIYFNPSPNVATTVA